MRRWQTNKYILNENCKFVYFDTPDTKDNDDLINVQIYDSNGNLIGEGKCEDEAYYDAKEEIQSRNEKVS